MSLENPDLSAEDGDLGEATRDRVFLAAERLFALNGFQAVSVRDITAEAGVNLAAVNYHFGSKDGLLFEIFRHRTSELNRTRARLLHEATDKHAGKPPLRAILEALLAPPVLWLDPAGDRRIALQFLIRARSEGTEQIREVLRTDVSHLKRFADALRAARPDLPPEEVYWRLHFVLGLIHQNRSAELERLSIVSGGLSEADDVRTLLMRMVDFAEAGFRA
jgi:AcrR family transcriptional regulator